MSDTATGPDEGQPGAAPVGPSRPYVRSLAVGPPGSAEAMSGADNRGGGGDGGGGSGRDRDGGFDGAAVRTSFA
ncbi:MAG: hypothetical protein IRZ08_20820, partial [Frankia sp.]|nr:hypothetical protein [Frankia sp.]